MLWVRGPPSLFCCGYPIVSGPFVEETIVFTLNGLGTLCQESINHRYMGLFLDSKLILFVYISIFMSVPHSLSYWSFNVNFEIKTCKFFFLKIILVIWSSLKFHSNFRICLPISTKMPLNFLRNCVEYMDGLLWEVKVLIILCPLIHEQECVFIYLNCL